MATHSLYVDAIRCVSSEDSMTSTSLCFEAEPSCPSIPGSRPSDRETSGEHLRLVHVEMLE